MQRLFAWMMASLLAAAPVGAQKSIGMSTEQTRQMNSLSKMGQAASNSGSRPESFEETDDPTLSAHPLSRHEPPKEARKAAQRAEHLARKGQHEEAVAEYRAAVDQDPQYFEAWINLALELDASGKTDESLETLRHLTMSQPEHVLGFLDLATLLCRLQRYPEAEAVTREALKFHNYSFKANYMLGSVLINQDKWSAEAKAKLEYAEAKYPEAKVLLKKWPAKAEKN